MPGIKQAMKYQTIKTGLTATVRHKLIRKLKEFVLVGMAWVIALALVYIVYVRLRLLFHP
jgi:hypothetical protein